MTGHFRLACLQTPAFGLHEPARAAGYLLEAIDRAAVGAEKPDLILLPECAYPAYFLAPLAGGDLDAYLVQRGAPTTEAFCRQLSERARQHGVALAAGLALPGPGGLVNALVVWDGDGSEVLRTSKLFLWHFDSRWFCPGPDVAVGEVAGVRVGLFICADGRLPEIPRLLALQGAQLLLDATNWVATGRDPAQLPNAQPDYLMRVRAMENRIYLAAANKVGREADTVVYCGKSLVIAPDGQVLAQASVENDEIITAAIPRDADGLRGAGQGSIAGLIDPLRARRGSEYTRLGTTPAPDAGADPFIAVAQVDPDGEPGAIDLVLANLEACGAALIVAPETRPGSAALPFWAERSAGLGCYLLATGDGVANGQSVRLAWLLQGRSVVHTWIKGHLSPDEGEYAPGPAEPQLWESPWGKVGVMQGGEGLIPEVPRGLALAGADLILWPNRLPGSTAEIFVRARAAENRLFVAMANPAVTGAESMLAGPDGLPLARTFPGARQGVGATLIPALSRHKDLVPDTHALGGERRPAFGRLV